MRRLQSLKPSSPERDGRSRSRNRSPTTRARAATSIFQVPVPPGGKRHASCSRASMMSTTMSDVSKRVEPETNDNELLLLYDKSLQIQLELMIMERKSQARGKELLSQVAALGIKLEQNEQKLHELKMREMEVINLIGLQEKLDGQIAETKATLRNYKRIPTELLGRIQSMITDFRVLVCENCKVPRTQDELESFMSSIEKFIELISTLKKRIGDEDSMIAGARKNVKEFTDTHEIFNKQFEILEESTQNLQIYVLQETSANLAARSPDRNDSSFS